MATRTAYRGGTPVPTIAITLPLELPLPDGFDAWDLATWPLVEGRLEYVDGRLLYMPPSGDEQQDKVADVTVELGLWTRGHPEFLASTNEAGIILGRDVRAVDASVYRRIDVGPYTGGLRRVPPVFAVEVAGKDEAEDLLLEKAAWYLDRGVEVVWVLVPRPRRVIVKTLGGSVELGPGERLPATHRCPGSSPASTISSVRYDKPDKRCTRGGPERSLTRR
jgi:Uma2 family endonuclease